MNRNVIIAYKKLWVKMLINGRVKKNSFSIFLLLNQREKTKFFVYIFINKSQHTHSIRKMLCLIESTLNATIH